jgi:nucleotide-binding universal stress UspA family protein
MYRRILVPLDGSGLAERALDHAERVAAPDATVTLLEVVAPQIHAMDFADTHSAERLAREPQEDLEWPRESARAYLARVAARVVRPGLTVVTRAAQGHPVERIIEAARDADLVVMSTHGRVGLAHLLMGSVAERVVRHAPVPVLVVR